MKYLRLVRFLVPVLTLALLLASAVPALAQGPDPTGADTLKADPTKAVNFAWTLVAAFLVFFMQAGFAFLGAGLIRSKNTVNYMTKSFLDFCMGGLAFFFFGFAFMFGGSQVSPGLDAGNPFIGYSGFLLLGQAYDVTTNVNWFFQLVFAATAATIVAGAVAERMKIQAYLAYSFLVSALIYPIYGHWVWGGGWLQNLSLYLPFLGEGVGARDFAGSGVVHTVGGLTALVGAALVGARLGKFSEAGKPNVIPGHNVVYVVMGTFFLFFGWFGFNPGSTLAATDLRISVIAVNTFLAGVAGAVTGLYLSLFRTGKADIVMACNGSLAGLVGITAPCAYVAPWASVVIGVIAALIMAYSLEFVEQVLKVDDAVGAVSVHAAGGLWGLLAVGIFADGTYGGVKGLMVGAWPQFVAQLVDMAAVTVWTLVTAWLMFWLIKKTIGLRASREEELSGLDIPEHGLPAYAPEMAKA